MRLELITGKSHQLRAHLAALGHPIIGDAKYIDRKTFDVYKSRYGIKSQLLTAYKIIFPEKSHALPVEHPDSLAGKTFETKPMKYFTLFFDLNDI